MAARSVRRMDDIGAADVAVGQVWLHDVCHVHERLRWRVTAVGHDHVTLERVDDGQPGTVPFGALLALWVLVEEAPTGGPTGGQRVVDLMQALQDSVAQARAARAGAA